MIKVVESTPRRVPGLTSLIVKFDYRPEYVEAIKSLDGATYLARDKLWEVPYINLSKFLDTFCLFDDIELTLLEDKEQVKGSKFITDFKTKLFPYQEDGVRYGLSHDKWLLLDGPGLGKSIQLLYLAQELKARGEAEHCLIVCGLNILKQNWKIEIQKHTDLSCRILGEKVSSKGKASIGGIKERLEQLKSPIEEFFVITNVETLRNDDIVKEINHGINKFDICFADEIHKLKSSQSQQGSNFLGLCPSSKYKVGATGTLLLNNPLDAYVPLSWIGADQAAFTNFKYFFCNVPDRRTGIITGVKNLEVLKDSLEKVSLRRQKSLLNLPPKVVIEEVVEMEDSQNTFYNNIKQGIKETADLVHLKTANLLSLMIRLRQATSCPSVLSSKPVPCAKLDRACDLVTQTIANGEKVLVYSSFKETIKVLAEMLKEYNPLICTGDSREDDITRAQQLIQNDPQSKLLLATWQKLGTGVTLTAITTEIFIDTPWTEGDFEQAQDRCHRIGSTKSVFIYNLITKDTVDELVANTVKRKSALADFVVDDKIETESAAELLRQYIIDM